MKPNSGNGRRAECLSVGASHDYLFDEFDCRVIKEILEFVNARKLLCSYYKNPDSVAKLIKSKPEFEVVEFIPDYVKNGREAGRYAFQKMLESSAALVFFSEGRGMNSLKHKAEKMGVRIITVESV